MLHKLFVDTINGIETKLQEAGPRELKARKLLALQSARIGERLFSGEHTVALCGVVTPFEIVNAMGIAPCFAEFVGATLAGTGDVGPMIDAAEQAGYPTDACTYHRTAFGTVRTGLMPAPDLLIGTSCPCSSGLALLEEMARFYRKPMFVLHIPHRNDEAAMHHLAGQLEAMVAFITEHTGRELEPERLRHAIELGNRTRELLIEVYELAATVPTPARRRDMINFGIVLPLSYGTEAAVEVARAYRDEFRAKVEHGIPGIAHEQARLMWFQNRIQFRTQLEEMLEHEYGAAVVVDELNDVTWEAIDPDEPYPGIARRILTSPLTGGIDRRIRRLTEQARTYQVDGMISPCHWGCRQGTGSRGMITAGLRDVGVPVLNLEVDCLDQRNFSEGQFRTRLQAFMEMVGEHRAARLAS